ncbi:MAG: SIS domain-containing protein [Pseudomonadota bacterium]
MRNEINEIPAAAARLIEDLSKDCSEIGPMLRARDPAFVMTVARGSSDHAAAFIKYAIEIKAGLAVASIGPSVASIYGATLSAQRAVCLSISQSGRSPDIVAMQKAAGAGGALTLALTNDPQAPLADQSDVAIDIKAGPEHAVAATKSFVNSVLAGLMVVAAWTQDAILLKALYDMPGQLQSAVELDWSSLEQALEQGGSLYILGRGPTYAIAEEAALKFKEVCNRHAEAYSAAEVLHGPVSLVGSSFPVLAFAARDAAEASIRETAEKLAEDGATVLITSAGTTRVRPLAYVDTGHPLTDALALIVPLYGFMEALARRHGLDPDKPQKLNKITETL